MRFSAIIWKEWTVLKNKFISTTLGAIVGPLLFLVAFGWGLGNAVEIDGGSYIDFVIPGIIAMLTMTTSFNVVANDINISRVYSKTFEAVMIAPIKTAVFVLARVTASALRGLYGAALILVISLLFGANLHIDWYFVLVLILNCFVFSTAGIIAGIIVDSHADMAKITSFVITPMSFLSGTFFPLDRFPDFLRVIFELLPLTQAIIGLREGVSAAGSWIVPVVLFGYLIVMLPISIILCRRAE